MKDDTRYKLSNTCDVDRKGRSRSEVLYHVRGDSEEKLFTQVLYYSTHLFYPHIHSHIHSHIHLHM